MSPASVIVAPATVNELVNVDMKKKGTSVNPNVSEAAVCKQKRKFESSQDVGNARKMPKRAAACKDFKDKPARFSEKLAIIEKKREQVVEEELEAIGLTTGHDDPRPNRRLTDFVFHDVEGQPQPVEMMEVTDIFISGVILPLEESSGREKEKGIRCNGFGRLESWAISGYEEGSQVIWVSTEFADYDCVKPASSYKNMYSLFDEKAHACIEVYQKLTKACGGDPNICFEDLLARVVRSMSERKSLRNKMPVKDFILSQGEFIYDQLVGLDDSSKKSNLRFSELPALLALKEESRKSMGLMAGEMDSSHASHTTLRIGGGDKTDQMEMVTNTDEGDEDLKMARLLQEKENWKSARQSKTQRMATPSNKYYIKINEDEITNDYPLPAYYRSAVDETDEYVIFEGSSDANYPDNLPRSMLHNWALYNSDSRLISLELLPMKPCADIDVTIYGSGSMTDDDGTGYCLDGESHGSSNSDVACDVGGLPIYLSAIKEWMIEFGSSMVFISIRTDMAWYRLGKPSKQYAAWYEPVLKTARLAISIITLLKEQSRVSRLSFSDIINRLSEFDKDHPAYISTNKLSVERYVVVHGQIILQQFAEFPDDNIRKSAFVTGLQDKMEERHHTKWLVKKRLVLKKELNTNPRAQMQSEVSKRKAMPATTTRLINRIWGEYYSNYSPEDTKEKDASEVKDEEIEEEQEEDGEDLEEAEEGKEIVTEQIEKPSPASKPRKRCSLSQETRWIGEAVGRTCKGEALYKQAIVCGDEISVGCSVLVETEDPAGYTPVCLIEYMLEDSHGKQLVHGRLMTRGCQTVLGNTANERELFLTDDCLDFELADIMQPVVVELRVFPWGHQHRKSNAAKDKIDRERAAERKIKGLPMEYFCKSVYCPDKGGFFSLSVDTIGLGSGICSSCALKQSQREKVFKVNSTKTGFAYEGINYSLHDFVYIAPHYFSTNEKDYETHKGGRNVGLRAYAVCQLLGIEGYKSAKQVDPESVEVKVRRFYKPEDISAEKAYRSDIQEIYYSEDITNVPLIYIEGKCEVRRKPDFISTDTLGIFEHNFFCEKIYDHNSGATKQLPANVKLSPPKQSSLDEASMRKKKGKSKEGDEDQQNVTSRNRLATLDIFAGCGGLSEGLEKSGVSQTKWAIEYEEPAGQAFRLNHPEAIVIVNNCNVILRAIMNAHGDTDDCISTEEAIELAAKLDEKEISSLPRPGEVDFINGGPPCQGFSGMNRFNHGTWSKVQCEMILAFLSFAEYFRPKFFLLENVRNFVSFNKGQTFRLAIASLLEMGYQVRFGILDAGAYGVSQSRKRAFIWAASPEEILPEWPEPMHVFSGPELKITLDKNTQYAAVRSTSSGAPFRAITVRDTIGDLPDVNNGASATTMEYKDQPESWYQKKIRGETEILVDHIAKEMIELNLIRCKRIPKRPGADWRDLPDEKVRLANGQLVDLIPWCLPNTAKRHNQWKGLFGRLDWEGNFPTSVTDPQPMGKVGMCFHPEQDRIITVRECARSQGFPDSYKFAGNIQHKHRQIGNAVPPPLAYALGRKLKEAFEEKAKIS